MRYLERSFSSAKPATINNALYFTGNAMADSDAARNVIFNQLNLFQRLYRIMFLEPVNTSLISKVMWNLWVLADARNLDVVIKDA